MGNIYARSSALPIHGCRLSKIKTLEEKEEEEGEEVCRPQAGKNSAGQRREEEATCQEAKAVTRSHPSSFLLPSLEIWVIPKYERRNALYVEEGRDAATYLKELQ